MSKPARGTKRVCPSCGARFYDLGHSPITCPVCQAAYQVTPPTPTRRTERPAPAEPPKPEVEASEPPVMGDAEVVSLEEAAEAEEAAVDDDALVDLGDDGDDEIPDSDGDDNTFLEQDEESSDDVSDIVGNKKADET